MNTDHSASRTRRAGRLILLLLLSVPIPGFGDARTTAIAYAETANMMRADLSGWLLAAAMVMRLDADASRHELYVADTDAIRRFPSVTEETSITDRAPCRRCCRADRSTITRPRASSPATTFTDGRPSGMAEDVVTGFLDGKGHARGRPVGLTLDKTGALLIADDVGNTVWRVSTAPQPQAANSP